MVKKVLKYILIALLIVVVAVVGLVIFSLIRQQKISEHNNALMHKEDADLLGQRLSIPREDKDPVRANLYIPNGSGPFPVVFNLHGGAFISGDADTLDSQSRRIADSWKCIVVTVNYTLAKDGYDIPYAVEEVTDAVLYVYDHAADFNAAPDKLVTLGYSAGGYHALAAAIHAKEAGVDLAGQVLCYPFISDALDLYNALSPEQQNLPPALFVLCGPDPISQGSKPYEELLRQQGVTTKVIEYETAIHGFIEENNPEYEGMLNMASKSPEQEDLAREAEQAIGEWLNKLWNREVDKG